MMSKDKVSSLLKEGQLEVATALIRLSESLTPRQEFNELILTFFQDSEFLQTALKCDCVEIFDYGIRQGIIDVQTVSCLVSDKAREYAPYTISLISALKHRRRPRLTPINRLGPALIFAYFVMHLSMAHYWLPLHLLTICLFVSASVLTWVKSGHYASCSSASCYATPFSTNRCTLCHLPMRLSQQWHRKQVHCRYCNICVDRFDHHCFWLGCCVNENNYGGFLLSLISALYMYFLGLLDSAVYFYKRAKIPVQIKTGIAVQLLCYIGFFTTLLMHINRRRYATRGLADRFRK